MTGFLLKVLTGSAAGPWIFIGVALALFAAGGTAGYMTRGAFDAPALAHQETLTAQADGRTTQCKLEHETGRATANQAVITALGESITGVNEIITKLNKLSGQRSADTAKFLEALGHAPETSICLGSAAERAYRNSVH